MLLLLYTADAAASAELKLKHPRLNALQYRFNLPGRAPVTYEEISRLNLPQINAFALHLENRKTGRYTGPDGGSVIIYKNRSYRWQLKNGITYTHWHDDLWQIAFNNAVIFYTPDNYLRPLDFKIAFKDGSIIYRRAHKKEGIYQYTYSNRRSRLYYDIVHPTYWGSYRAQVGRFHFIYSENWHSYIEAFKNWQGRESFMRAMKEQYGFESRRITVILHESEEKFREFSAGFASPDGCTGWAVKGFLTLCPRHFRMKPVKNEKAREIIYHNKMFTGLLHDTIHLLEKNRCDIVNRGRGNYRQQKPGTWYIEGIAELGIVQTHLRYRQTVYERFYRLFSESRPPFVRAGDDSFNHYRTLGVMFLEYLSHRFGNTAIRDFYDSTCRDIDPSAAFRKTFGDSEKNLFNRMYDYYNRRRAEYESKYTNWKATGLYNLEYKNRTGNRQKRIRSILMQKYNKADEYSDLPRLHGLFDLSLKGIPGDYADWFSDRAGNLIYLHKNRSYVIYDYKNRYEAYVWPGGTTEFRIKNYRITGWQNGQRRLTYSNGRYLHCYSKNTGCRLFSAGGKEIK